MLNRRGHWSSVLLLVALAAGACDRSNSSKSESKQSTLVLYTSVDEPYVKPIVAEFESKTGIKVLLQTDTEATKSAGLAAKLEAERDKPRADVWWGNEVFHTIRLADAGLLTPYESRAGKDVGEKFKDASHRWTGNGLRARVIASHGSIDGAKSLADLVDPKHKGRVAMARPTAGTTGGHVAALYVLWGRDKFSDYFTKLKANEAKLLGGNGPVAEAVGRGEVDFGLTDNDDVASVGREGGKISSSLVDQDTDGTLAIPTTVALVAKGPNSPDDAKKLIDYLLSAEVEKKLIDDKFAGWSVRDSSSNSIRTMKVDFRDVSKALPEAVETAMTILEGRK